MNRHLSLDANVYLSFYRLSRDNLEELAKLAKLVQGDEITLVLTEQVKNEFERNRERVIRDAIKQVQDSTKAPVFPLVVRSLDEFEATAQSRREYEMHLSAVIEETQERARARTLPADVTIEQLMANANFIETTAALIESATERASLGQPPGKKGSLGDAVTWEALLELARSQPSVTLDVVTADQDFVSALTKGQLDSFLQKEWESITEKPIVLFESLGDYLGKRYPQIKFASQVDAELRVRNLENSRSFSSTHATVAGLEEIPEFSPDQVQRLVSAFHDNDQVHQIAGDSDVKGFFFRLLKQYRASLDSDEYSRSMDRLLER